MCIMTGPEFGTLKDHHLIIDRALYGLPSSGQRWHERFAECMTKEELEMHKKLCFKCKNCHTYVVNGMN